MRDCPSSRVCVPPPAAWLDLHCDKKGLKPTACTVWLITPLLCRCIVNGQRLWSLCSVFKLTTHDTHTEVHVWNLINADCKWLFDAAPPVNVTFIGSVKRQPASVYVSEASLWAKKKSIWWRLHVLYTYVRYRYYARLTLDFIGLTWRIVNQCFNWMKTDAGIKCLHHINHHHAGVTLGNTTQTGFWGVEKYIMFIMYK